MKYNIELTANLEPESQRNGTVWLLAREKISQLSRFPLQSWKGFATIKIVHIGRWNSSKIEFCWRSVSRELHKESFYNPPNTACSVVRIFVVGQLSLSCIL
ncbi:uncharacterized protein PHALS_14734 [Plasmopara halstedii]|uniref:Uncharacterized protein n=1 Tax=Plasmopara halstedii TaxID=4781 RepID=A0A0P1AVE3_PLAHL|nr:uncharacterized protein PHALS_14734 [Plasmopara halstedii]CEG45082.1 hypothetical protein PHALS_14734 [Plasmopara halstedii]|eukprot:XP_024581451.1 hypothetical protein PHALS_14734 [Plasmopara halstedii]